MFQESVDCLSPTSPVSPVSPGRSKLQDRRGLQLTLDTSKAPQQRTAEPVAGTKSLTLPGRRSSAVGSTVDLQFMGGLQVG